MRILTIAIVVTGLLIGAQSSRAAPESRTVFAKQQLSACMSKRMSASRAVSYNEAMRACKQQSQPPKETLASNSPGDTGTKAH